MGEERPCPEPSDWSFTEFYLFFPGMVDVGEQEYMLDPLDRKMRHLEIVGECSCCCCERSW